MLTNWATAVEGMAAGPGFKVAMGALQDGQGVLREWPETQSEYVQGLRGKLPEGGGTPEDQARIDQVERVIEASNKQRDTDPLLWLASVTGKPAEPLDIRGAMQDGNLQAMGAAIQDRMDTIAAVRGAYGPGVQVHPLLPQESKMLANAVQALTPDQPHPLFGMLRQSIGSDDAYNAVMQQIAPDAPLKAHAGQLAVLPGGDKVASLILRGEALLDSKEGKQKWPMPADKNFTEAFIDIAGDAYQARPNDIGRAHV